MSDISKSDNVLTSHELNQIIAGSPRVLKVTDVSSGHSPEGIQLLLRGSIEVDEDKDSPYPHHVSGVALVKLTQLMGHIDIHQTDSPMGQDQALENQNHILANQTKILAALDRIEKQKK